MPDSLNRVAIDRVDWKSVLPVLRLASAFKHALQPGKLFVAFTAVLAIHLSGTVLDLVWTGSDDPYQAILKAYSGQLHQLFQSIFQIELGIGSLSSGVIGSLFALAFRIPHGSFSDHPWFTVVFGIDVLFVLAIASGVLTRMAASQVCANRLTSLSSAVGFIGKRWVWFLLTPLMPAVLLVLIAALLALTGLLFFNVPWLEAAGALLYGLFILMGFVMAIVSMLLLFGLFLMPPALSVEGSDGFDAIARSFNYILFKPWQFGAYLLAAILYLAVVYVLIGTLASASVDATAEFVEFGAFTKAKEAEHARFDVVSGRANLPEGADASISAAVWLVARWAELVTALVIAILFSTLCCLQTQVYVLMRRTTDSTPMNQYDSGDQTDLWADSSEQAPADDATSKAEDGADG
ncbi:MAG: hypothetical protein AAGI37_11125 [Planctomycetota bacterium]